MVGSYKMCTVFRAGRSYEYHAFVQNSLSRDFRAELLDLRFKGPSAPAMSGGGQDPALPLTAAKAPQKRQGLTEQLLQLPHLLLLGEDLLAQVPQLRQQVQRRLEL